MKITIRVTADPAPMAGNDTGYFCAGHGDFTSAVYGTTK
jgi:hypothetical protein